MIELWAQHVEAFKEERSSQMSEWWEFLRTKRAEIPDKYQGQTITATYPEREGLGWFGDENKCRSIYDEVAAKVEDLKERERTNYQKFEDNADDIGEKLRQGPTKENVQALIDAGINSWAFYNLDPNHYTMLVDRGELTEENAEEWAEELEGYWSGNQPIDSRYHELMLMMSMITTNAMQAQQGGTGYGNEEMDFLRAFYDALEEDPSLEHMGVIGIPAKMEDGHLSEEEREHALGVLGDGLLALSDERLGGGYDDLPASVRSVVDGPDFSGVRSGGDYSQIHTDWMERADYLDDLLSSSHEDFEGGAEFSTRMMDTISTSLVRIDALGGSDSSMSGLLDVATRNEDANYAILTGEYPEGVEGDLPWTEETADNVTDRIIGQLYTHEWGDDGEAARGLTEWIEEFQNSDDPDKVDQGSEAFLALLETITDPEMHERPNETGHSVEDEEKDVTWENVSFTHLNPEIADSFADLFLNNIEVMENSVGFNFDEDAVGENDDPSIYDVDDEYLGDGKLILDPMTRLVFAEYIVGSEDAAARLEAASFFRTEEAASTYFNEYPPDVSEARDSGIFDALIDKAIEKEHQNRFDATNGAIDYKNQVTNNATDMVAAVFNEIPVPGISTASEIMKQGFKEVMSMDHIDAARDTSSDFSPIALDNRATLHAAIAVENSGEHTFGEDVDFLRDPDTGEISLDPHHWISEGGGTSFDSDAYQDALDSIYSELRDMKWPGAENELGSSVISDFSRFSSAGREALDSRT